VWTPTWMTLRDRISRMKKANSERKKRSVTCKQSHAQMSLAWFCRKVAQFCPRRLGVRVCLMYFCMLRLQTRMPSLSNSPRIRSAQKTPILRRHFLDQSHGFCGYFWFRRCCSGLILPEQARIPADATTGASLVGQVMCTCLHARDARARRTKIRRSVFAHVGRLTCRRRMMSGCRRRAFSATSSDLLLARSATIPNRREGVEGVVQSTKRWWSD